MDEGRQIIVNYAQTLGDDLWKTYSSNMEEAKEIDIIRGSVDKVKIYPEK